MKEKFKNTSVSPETRSQIGLYEMLALAKPDSNHENSALLETLTYRINSEVDQDERDT